MFDWLWSTLTYVGVVKKKSTVLFLGLDNAGKSTLLQMLKDDKLKLVCTSYQPIWEEVKLHNIDLCVYDFGGHIQARFRSQEYLQLESLATAASAVIFVVDASDRDRFPEVQAELEKILSHDELANVPVLILGNKVDRPDAVSEEDLSEALGLSSLTTGKESLGEGLFGRLLRPSNASNTTARPLEIFMCSVVKRNGYHEGINWLANQLLPRHLGDRLAY
eukprot:NODE_6692_length_825_cov_53.576923_g6456_i0.p1 GENE.NODE_6692_length_825_cov_53.576923_g6456_i0~~NODE_6692_length_825_cov_53.576923_g6456_i0.p1  ORF type:complete len:239 (+),score=46.27 NODE_6692_length_825_cov_53.576923_g6456_i0:58-717(+)